MKLDTIRKSYFVYLITMLVLAIIGTLNLLHGDLSMRQVLGGFLLIMLLVLIGSTPMSILWWKQIDEAAREAHKTAWFWGGSIGMTVSLFVASLNLYFDNAFLDYLGRIYRVKDIHNFGFELGLLNVMTFMGLGYMIHWGIWWKSRMTKGDE